jgi:hypothetical protein
VGRGKAEVRDQCWNIWSEKRYGQIPRRMKCFFWKVLSLLKEIINNCLAKETF